MKNRFLPPCAVRRTGLLCAAAAIAVFTVTTCTQASAVLGGSEGSVQTDQAHMRASLKSMLNGAYTVRELRAPTGVVVREYVADGNVFGVAWKGKYPPDMRQLLGSYFDTYQKLLQAQNQNSRGRRPVHIETPGLVVNVSGHMGFFHGQSFIPDMLPQSMKSEDIR